MTSSKHVILAFVWIPNQYHPLNLNIPSLCEKKTKHHQRFYFLSGDSRNGSISCSADQQVTRGAICDLGDNVQFLTAPRPRSRIALAHLTPIAPFPLPFRISEIRNFGATARQGQGVGSSRCIPVRRRGLAIFRKTIAPELHLALFKCRTHWSRGMSGYLWSDRPLGGVHYLGLQGEVTLVVTSDLTQLYMYGASE